MPSAERQKVRTLNPKAVFWKEVLSMFRRRRNPPPYDRRRPPRRHGRMLYLLAGIGLAAVLFLLVRDLIIPFLVMIG